MVPHESVHTQKRSLRQLLPAERRPGDGQSGGEVQPLSESSTVKSKPLASGHVLVACTTCRRLKVKCSGERPRCVYCVRRNKACEYEYDVGENKSRMQALKRRCDDLETQYNIHGSIYDALKSRPEAEALAIFQQIRSGADPATVLQHIHHGYLLLHLSTRPDSKYYCESPVLANVPTLIQQANNNPSLASSLSELTLQPPPQSDPPVQE